MLTKKMTSVALTAAVGVLTTGTLVAGPVAAADPTGRRTTSVHATATADSTAAADRDRRLRRVLRDDTRTIRAGFDVPGVLVEMRAGDGAVRVRAGVGDRRTGTPIPWQARFRIASFTKTFVATTLLQLVEEGRLGLDDPVADWLPGLLQGHGNDGRKITVRDVLQQTSGLPDYLTYLNVFTKEGFQRNRFRTLTGRQAVRLAVAGKSLFAPGSEWGYSNTNYAVAGLLIEEVTGTSWQRQVRERIVEPLGLDHTSAPSTSRRLPQPHARGYERFPLPGSTPEDLQYGTPLDATRLNPSWAGAAGGMISSATDGNRFLQALVTGKVLGPEMLAEMQTTVPLSEDYQQFFPGGRYGLGLFRIATSCGVAWSHGGDIMGFLTRNAVTPDGDRSVMVSFNTDSPVPDGGGGVTEDPAADLVDHALCGP